MNRATVRSLPTGTVTFLFTDIEGSTKLWERNAQGMQSALARHDTLIREAIAASGGFVFKTMGDAFCAVFSDTSEAIMAAVAGQIALLQEPWPLEIPIRVRMALHTGLAEERDADYFGPVLNRVARLLSAGHGGQILASGATEALCQGHLPPEMNLRDRGTHRLKDLTLPEHVFEIAHPTLPLSLLPLNTLDNTPNNLPQQVTSFIGREKEMQTTRSLLGGTHLLTLVGTGGSGKTRLALHVAAEILDEYPDGVWFVELAPLSDPALVPQTVSQVLGIREPTGQAMTQMLTEQLREKKSLLLLDNCEHVLSSCGALVAALLRACPGVRILATSREPLGIAGEQCYRIPSLALPDLKSAARATPDSLCEFESVRLLRERAQAVKPEWLITATNAVAVAQLCCRLDGIPLALELAAARVRSLSLEQINDRLDSRFRLLTGGDRSVLPRQQTLRALADWSYDLLSELEKVFFARLSVFAGGWDLEAAEAVCSCDPIQRGEVLDLLTSLVDKSLVVAEEAESEIRYRMLETLRQYGAEKRENEPEAGQVQHRHLAYFVEFAEKAESQLVGPDQARWLNRLETEHDNLRATLEFCANHPDEKLASIQNRKQLALRLVGAVWRFWDIRGYLSEGRKHLRRALAGTSEPCQTEEAVQQGKNVRAKALNGAGLLAMSQGDYGSAQELLAEALSSFRRSGNSQGIVRVLNSRGNLEYDQGNFIAARPLYEECLVLGRMSGDTVRIAGSLNNLGNIAVCEGKHETARALYQESLALFRHLGEKNGVASSLLNLGYIASSQSDCETASPLFKECLGIYIELGNKIGVANSLEGLASVLLSQGDFRTSAVLWGARDGLRERVGVPLTNGGQGSYEQYRDYLAHIQSALGENAFSAAWNEGSSLGIDQVIEVVRLWA